MLARCLQFVVVKLFCNTLFDKYLFVTSLHGNLKFLLLWGDLDDYIDLMDELESNKKEMEEMTADAEEYSAEERDEIQEYIIDLQKEKDYYWNKFSEQKHQKRILCF